MIRRKFFYAFGITMGTLSILTGCSNTAKPEELSSTENTKVQEVLKNDNINTDLSKIEVIKIEKDIVLKDGTVKDKIIEPANVSKTEEIVEEIPEEPFFTVIEENGIVYATGTVNIRELPTKDSNKLGVLEYTNSIKKTGICDNGWIQVFYNGNVAYISENYLSNTKPEPAQPYSGIIQKVGNVKDSVLKSMDSYFYKIPENVRNSFINNGWKVYATDEHLGRKFFGIDSSILAVTTDGEDAIYLHNREKAAEALVHEFGHYIDFISGYVSYGSEFREIFLAEADAFRAVHSTHANNTNTPMEYFAECYQEIVLHPDKVKNNCPRTYEFITRYANAL